MRHVIVTGGSRGLGLALVEGLLADGYRVSTCSRSRTEAMERLAEDKRYSDRFHWSACRIGRAEEAEKFVAEVMEWAGEGDLYGLINNAGVVMDGVLATFPTSSIQEILEVDLLGALQMARLATRVFLRRRQGGRILNISSVIGSRGFTGLAAYSAAKAGMDGMTRSLAREVGRLGVTVNSVAPGYLNTEMTSVLSQGQLDQIVRRTPMGRLGAPEDVLAVIRFLLSDSAHFITGHTIMVDGGLSC